MPIWDLLLAGNLLISFLCIFVFLTAVKVRKQPVRFYMQVYIVVIPSIFSGNFTFFSLEPNLAGSST